MVQRAILVEDETEDDAKRLEGSIREALNPMLPELGGEELTNWEFLDASGLVDPVEVEDDHIAIRGYDGERLLRWEKSEWEEDPSLIPIIAEAIRVGARKGPDQILQTPGIPREAPGTWEGKIWQQEPTITQATFRWINPNPDTDGADEIEIELFTDPGTEWRVALYEQEVDEEGNVADGIAQQPRLDGQPINPGQGRTYRAGMAYVEALMQEYP